MTMRRGDAVELVGDLLPVWKAERERLDVVDEWYRGRNEEPWAPNQATREMRRLRDRSITPWLSLVVTAVAQSLYVEGYRRAEAPDDATPWAAWQANGMDARQSAVFRGALAHAVSYVTVLPGDLAPVIRGISARRLLAVYADPAEDEWPMYALRVDGHANKALTIRLYDEETVTFLGVESLGSAPEWIDERVHGLGVCPVVRYANQLDLDGRSTGEVEPYIPIAGRIDQTTFDRLIVQRYGSWKVRTVTGMAEPETDDEKRAVRRLLEVGDLLVAEDPDTKFGTLDETPLEPYVSAKDADIRDLAAVSQTPPHHLLGQMANLSAEALAAAEASLSRKVEERKHTFGESTEQALRLAGLAAGDLEAWGDTAAQVIWRDMGSRSLAQAADALGKLAQMLGVPVEILWEKIPGWTQTDVERAKELRDQDPVAELAAVLGSPPPATDTTPDV